MKLVGGEMASKETAMECLRRLVNTKPWDYVVIWELGDDPSKFIQWGTCCCSGGNTGDGNGVEKDKWCRDQFMKHSIKTKACRKLAQLPSVIPLYSGIHGDVVTSKQPVWTSSASDNEPNGTQVLVPVAGSLIEFFSSKHVPWDQKIIDYVSAQFGQEFAVAKTKETAPNLNLKEQLCEIPNSYDWQIHCLNFLSQPHNNYSSFEGSSPCSSLSNEHQAARRLGGSDRVFSGREQLDLQNSNPKPRRKKCPDSGCNNKVGAKNRERGPYKSKNLVTERNRRERIKARMFALRSIVPKITKMDRAATLGDAAEYIEELHEAIEEYKSELRKMEDQDKCGKVINGAEPDYRPKIGGAEMTPTAVEVNQLGTKDFLLKLVCSHGRGRFSRLMEAVDALGLQVTNANVTTLNGAMSNVLRVEAEKEEVDPKALECLLVRLVT